jgi:hypothetical protein
MQQSIAKLFFVETASRQRRDRSFCGEALCAYRAGVRCTEQRDDR